MTFFSGVLETDYPAGEEVPQDLEANQGDVVSLAGSVASVGSTGSDGIVATEGTSAIPQTANTDQPAEHGASTGSGTSLLERCSDILFLSFCQHVSLQLHLRLWILWMYCRCTSKL